MKIPSRVVSRLVLALCLLVPAASAVAGIEKEKEDNHAGKANVRLSGALATLIQTSDTAWTLSKTGAGNTASTVSWTITATQGSTVGGHLVADGFLAVTNMGSGGATIGNIVVNLQTMSNGQWVTQSSDIADATHGDAATSAHVVAAATTEHLATFTTNAASGRLEFMDATTNTAFSLVPAVTIPAGQTVRLLFTASFNNNVLGLGAGTPARIEVIVTFGNHAPGGWNLGDEHVDINGNGRIDWDEAKVRSVSTLIHQVIPATQAANTTLALSDTPADITTAGTVTFTNPVIQIGATTGTVQVTYNGGVSGGSLTNCAHATGSGITTTVGQFHFPNVAPVELDACDTETVGAHICSPGALGCGWQDGQMLTYDQASWSSATTLSSNYDALYASTFGTFVVGVSGTPGMFSLTFTGGTNVAAFLPQIGTPAALNSNLINPTSSAAGVFGAEVVGLKLNVDFSDAGLIGGTAALKFGDLTLCNFTAQPGLNGLTVRGFLGTVNSVLGGGPAAYAIADLESIAQGLNTSFLSGAASAFAQAHVVNGACQ